MLPEAGDPAMRCEVGSNVLRAGWPPDCHLRLRCSTCLNRRSRLSSRSRRSFAKSSALAIGAISSAPFNILSAENAGIKSACAHRLRRSWHLRPPSGRQGGTFCGGRRCRRGASHHRQEMASKQRWKSDEPRCSPTTARCSTRGKGIDAVFIAAPNHHHALPALIAMQLGKNVHCEKPVCHDIGEACAMRALAAKSKVATQMGNQGIARKATGACAGIPLGRCHRQRDRNPQLDQPSQRRRGTASTQTAGSCRTALG